MEQYVHLLIACPDEYIPVVSQVREFCNLVFQQQVFADVESIRVSTPSQNVRRGINPFTLDEIVIPMKDHQYLHELSEFESVAKELNDYELCIDGTGRPENPIIPITPNDPFALEIRCCVTSLPRSTSDVDPDNSEAPPNIVPFGKPCLDIAPFGYFTNPTTGSTIKVAGAGRARFCIEFEFGRWLFPTVSNDDLKILTPDIAALAHESFGIPFVQGCHFY